MLSPDLGAVAAPQLGLKALARCLPLGYVCFTMKRQFMLMNAADDSNVQRIPLEGWPSAFCSLGLPYPASLTLGPGGLFVLFCGGGGSGTRGSRVSCVAVPSWHLQFF